MTILCSQDFFVIFGCYLLFVQLFDNPVHLHTFIHTCDICVTLEKNALLCVSQRLTYKDSVKQTAGQALQFSLLKKHIICYVLELVSCS